MNDRRLVRLLADANELLTRVEAVLPTHLSAMREAQTGYPPSPRLDGDAGGGHTNVTFCEIHEKDRCECGEGMTWATVSDRTGEAAMRPDRAAVDRRLLEEKLKSIGRQSAEVVNLLARYTRRAPTDAERRETLSANERDGSCWSCARVGQWSPPWRTVEVPNGGRVLVCRWCYDWARDQGEAPAPTVLKLHHAGKTVRRPVPQRGGAA